MTKHTILDLYVIFDEKKGDLTSNEVYDSLPTAIVTCEELINEEKEKYDQLIIEEGLDDFIPFVPPYQVMTIHDYVFKMRNRSYNEGRYGGYTF